MVTAVAPRTAGSQMDVFLGCLGDGLAAHPGVKPYLITCDSARSFGLPAAFGTNPAPMPHVDVGVREGLAIGVAAGLAGGGFTPIVACFAAFAVLRGTESLRTLIAQERLPVILLGGMAGLSAGQNGISHHCTEDLAILHGMPAIRIYAPSDASSCEAAVADLLTRQAPAYVRLVRHGVPPLPPGVWPHQCVRVLGALGTPCAVVGYGAPLAMAVPALAQWPREHCVIEVGRINPLPGDLAGLLRGSDRIVVLDEHRPAGGLGDRLRASDPHLAERLRVIGVTEDPGSASYPDLLDAVGLTGRRLLAQLDAALDQR